MGGVDLNEFLAQYRDQHVMLIIAPVGEADPDVVLCGVCGFPMNEVGRCPRCALAVRDQADAFRREVEAERLLDDIERFLTGLDEDA